mgnify:CR=1 FL=1
MYRQHFGLTQHPFSNEVEPGDLFPATAAKEIEVRLREAPVTGEKSAEKRVEARAEEKRPEGRTEEKRSHVGRGS